VGVGGLWLHALHASHWIFALLQPHRHFLQVIAKYLAAVCLSSYTGNDADVRCMTTVPNRWLEPAETMTVWPK